MVIPKTSVRPRRLRGASPDHPRSGRPNQGQASPSRGPSRKACARAQISCRSSPPWVVTCLPRQCCRVCCSWGAAGRTELRRRADAPARRPESAGADKRQAGPGRRCRSVSATPARQGGAIDAQGGRHLTSSSSGSGRAGGSPSHGPPSLRQLRGRDFLGFDFLGYHTRRRWLRPVPPRGDAWPCRPWHCQTSFSMKEPSIS